MYGSKQEGKAPQDLMLSEFDYVYFTDDKVNELEATGIPYPMEWFLVMEAMPAGVRCVGSCGGGTLIGWDETVIRSHEDKQMGEQLVRPAGLEVLGIPSEGVLSILARNGIKDLSADAMDALGRIVGSNPGDTKAAAVLLKEYGLDKVKTAQDIGSALGVDPDKDAPANGRLWDRIKYR